MNGESRVDTMSAKERVLAVHKGAYCRFEASSDGPRAVIAYWLGNDVVRISHGVIFEAEDSANGEVARAEAANAAWEQAASQLPADATEPQSLTVAGGEETCGAKSPKTGQPCEREPHGECIYHMAGVHSWPTVAPEPEAGGGEEEDADCEGCNRDDCKGCAWNEAHPPVAAPSPATPAEGHPSEVRVWTRLEKYEALLQLMPHIYPKARVTEYTILAANLSECDPQLLMPISAKAIDLQCELSEIKNRGM